MDSRILIASLLLAAVLSACNGGGDSSTVLTSPVSQEDIDAALVVDKDVEFHDEGEDAASPWPQDPPLSEDDRVQIIGIVGGAEPAPTETGTNTGNDDDDDDSGTTEPAPEPEPEPVERCRPEEQPSCADSCNGNFAIQHRSATCRNGEWVCVDTFTESCSGLDTCSGGSCS